MIVCPAGARCPAASDVRVGCCRLGFPNLRWCCPRLGVSFHSLATYLAFPSYLFLGNRFPIFPPSPDPVLDQCNIPSSAGSWNLDWVVDPLGSCSVDSSLLYVREREREKWGVVRWQSTDGNALFRNMRWSRDLVLVAAWEFGVMVHSL